ncbi:MAG: HlyD family type I secretion periplasmic adaptor subunit [Rhodospirillaceae bacterium]
MIAGLIRPGTGPRAAERRFLLAGLGLLALLVLWATLAPLDVVSNAQGEVTPATRLKAVQHLEGGIVSEILVEEGALVKKGQALIRLDPIRAQSDARELTKRLTGLRLDVLRLGAEIEGRAVLDIPAELESATPDLAAQAREIFETRRKRAHHDLAIQRNLVIQREGDVRELGLRIANNRKSLEIITSEVQISSNMLRGDLTSRMAHLELLRQQQSLRTLLEGDENALPRSEAALAEARERLGSLTETQLEQARKELGQAQQQVDELGQRALKFANIEERTVLRAPVDGIVKTLAVSTEGGVIQPGQTVAEIVPVEDRLIIEAQLPIQDISYIHAGQPVRVTLASPEASVFGHLEGQVVRVSPDAVVSSGSQGTAGGGRSFYRVRIETRQSHFTVGGWDYQLYPGMQVLCSIRIGSRSVAEYLLSPWFRSLRLAFQER